MLLRMVVAIPKLQFLVVTCDVHLVSQSVPEAWRGRVLLENALLLIQVLNLPTLEHLERLSGEPEPLSRDPVHSPRFSSELWAKVQWETLAMLLASRTLQEPLRTGATRTHTEYVRTGRVARKKCSLERETHEGTRSDVLGRVRFRVNIHFGPNL